MRDQLLEKGIGVDSIRLGVEVEQHAMAEHGNNHRSNVVICYVITFVRKSAGLSRKNDELCCTNAGAEVRVFFDELRCGVVFGASGAHQADDVSSETLGDRNHAHELLKVEQIFSGSDCLNLHLACCGGAINYHPFVVGAEVIENRIEQETIKLRFGQRVGTLQLDRVLGGEDEEGLR